VAARVTVPDVAATPDDYPAIVRWARIALTLALVPLSWYAFHDRYGKVPMIGAMDLMIHEFGHVFFRPFGIAFLGRTMVILGGSLMQVCVPLIFMFYFLRNREGARDPHAAMVCLWWSSMNLLDVSVYCADARARVLMLISGETGQESEGHDWNNLLHIWHALDKDTVIAHRMRGVAWLACVVSIGMALWLAWDSGRQRASSEPSIG
jgi:hypothetical protein